MLMNPPESTFRFYPEGGSPEAVAIRGHNPYEKELRYFADCLRGEADPAGQMVHDIVETAVVLVLLVENVCWIGCLPRRLKIFVGNDAG